MEIKEKVLQSGYFLFDNKPMIFKALTKDLEMTKEYMKTVTAWIRLHKQPLKFWGKGLPKIAKLVGEYVKSDVATEERTRLVYARVMVEMVVDQQLPTTISFKDEKGSVTQVQIEYEWKPVKCTKCQGIGHDVEHCKHSE
ncbi:uncharacterized protein LOC141631613 [Silene latifolia]|uniref:uncharacterized protein LOC141631613 n=1 Tax=Silene latifolia TaxID=37657 RepID=UPI003D77147E